MVENQPIGARPAAAQDPIRGSSWVPIDRARAQMAKNNFYVLLILEGRLYSLDVDLLFELIAGRRESIRIFRLEEHGWP